MPAVLLSNRELWAVANRVLEDEAFEVDDYLAGRIQSLQEAGDHDGVVNWLAIASRIYQLLDRPEDVKALN